MNFEQLKKHECEDHSVKCNYVYFHINIIFHHQDTLSFRIGLFTSALAKRGYCIKIPEVLNVNTFIFTRICKKLLDGSKPNTARALASKNTH